MSRSAVRSGVAPADFLAWERTQPGRHEYFQGEIFAMAGGSPRHAALSARVARALGVALGRECEVFSSDLQLGFARDQRYVYADVTVVCGALRLQPGTKDVVENPNMVVEVLSPTTEEYDRGLKWEGYRALPSLTDYLLVSQKAALIEHFRREADGSWRYQAAGPGQRVALTGSAVLDVDAIFDGVFQLAGE
jgi:Uma2 family endonuclease